MTGTLAYASLEDVSLATALGRAGLDGANALLATPTRYVVGVVAGGGCRTRLGPVDLADVYEARCFGADVELRWLQDGPATADSPPTGTAVLVGEDAAVTGRLGVPVVAVEITDTIPGAYLLWGTSGAALLGSGWTVLEESRVGSFEVPLAVSAAGRRVRIHTVEYVGVDDEGNAAVVDERLTGFAELPFEEERS